MYANMTTLDRLTADEMISIYNECNRNLSMCAEKFGCSLLAWASQWNLKRCEQRLKEQSSVPKSNTANLINWNTYGNCTGANDYAKADITNANEYVSTYVGSVSDSTSWIVQPAVDDREGDKYAIGVISDLHFGSNNQQLTMLNNFVKICKDRDIRTLLCAGDISDGLKMRTGHENTIFLHSLDEMEMYIMEHYPEGFENNYFITGNHDTSLGEKRDGYDLGWNLIKDRTDLKYIPQMEQSTNTFKVDGGIVVKLYHGTGGCAKYRTTRTMEKADIFNSKGPFDLFLAGHCHTCSMIPSYKGMSIYGLPSFQATTTYLDNKGMISECGGLILNYQVDASTGKPFGFVPEFILDKQLGGFRSNDF